MTTTDPTPLAEQIAREHLRQFDTCVCGDERVEWIGDYADHIATVTEQAVRERVAALLSQVASEVEEQSTSILDPVNLAAQIGRSEAYRQAARIARGATP